MDNLLYVATGDGLATCKRENEDWEEVGRSLTGQRVTSVSAFKGTLLAGTEDGIYRSDDGGQSWQDASDGLTVRYVRWLAHHPTEANLALAGTEPASIFITRDDGQSWRECP